ncbi:MAG: DNA polymerase/3'-5' exonuclease PolX [bacterium]|nr:DNA polymerase/3'-5' exonuclease PolX [bacterium]
MKNQELSRIFSNLAAYMGMEGVAFKPRALEKAAAALLELPEDVSSIYGKEGSKGLEAIPGVGKGIAERIEEYVKTGKVKDYEAFKKKMPVDLEGLTAIEGVGLKMVRDLYKSLKVTSVQDLTKAAKAGKVAKVPGFGQKTEQNILQGIAFLERFKGRWLLGDIYPFAEEYVEKLKGSGLAERVVPAGSVRRMKETIGDIDLLVTTEKPKEVMEFFLGMVPHEKVWGKGLTKTSVRSTHGFDVDIRVLPEGIFGAALQYFTGSKEHNVKVRTLASKKGLKLSEYGLFKGKKLIACTSEEDVFKALGMQYVEPEMREDAGEVEAALRHELPSLIPYGALKGDLQVQTDWTDGQHSIEEMAKEAKRQGLEYIAITDHTRDLAMTGGSDEKKLERQMATIDKINRKMSGITILKGAEVNIRKDGTLDIADETLAKLDVVGISVHSNFKMSKRDMTQRILRAMRNPNADILFHPTGRLIFKREAYELDMAAVIKEAKKTKTVLEANAFPERLDLKDTDIRAALEAGVKISIDSDAHRKEHFKVLRYGIAQARRAWAGKKDVVNTLPAKQMLNSLKK